MVNSRPFCDTRRPTFLLWSKRLPCLMALIRISRTARPMKYWSDSSKPASRATRRTDSSAPSTDSTAESSVEENTAVASTRRLPVLSAGRERGNRIVAGGVHRQHFVHPGHLENGADAAGDARQAHLPAGIPHQAVASHQHADGGTIEVTDLGHVQHDAVLFGFRHLLNGPFQLLQLIA